MRYLFAVAIFAIAVPAAAGTRVCTANLASATCSNVCGGATEGLLYYSFSRTDPDGAGPLVSLSTELSDALCALNGYKATLPGGGANPESCPSFADRTLREHFRAVLNRYRDRQQEVIKQAALAANPAPLIP